MKSLRAVLYSGVLCSVVFLIAWHHKPLNTDELPAFIHPASDRKAEEKSPGSLEEPVETEAATEAPEEEIAAESTEKPDPEEPKTARVQPLEEREDDMLYEIEALHNMPFEEAVTMPFDSP